MDCIVQGVTKSQSQLSNFHFHSTPQDFPDSSVGKESACNAGDPGSVPGLGRTTGEGIGYSLQYSWTYLLAKESACNAGDLGLITGLGRSPRERNTHSSILS